MFKVMSTYDIGVIKLYVGQQNFNDSIVPVKVKDNIVNCPMYIDEDGDIYFEYEGNQIYFRCLK